ncbi:dNDP-4-keto-6-deoxy-glucose-2,3- dehydratase [Bacteroidia bacterium]|nr:dNDP-4-keto-6-deoxy-glucose-2,3- dehydratase [Bacteroidia bacterium]
MLIKSLLTIKDTLYSLEEIKEWIEYRNKVIDVQVERVPFASLEKWYQDTDGSLIHSSGRFFSIQGIRIETDYGSVSNWTQPIINQPEVGYLGILTKEFNGVLYFLMQAKIEPGNVNCVQISPTLQATKSNYRQIHQGQKPNYLDYFVNATPSQIILDQLQSEQGARFLRKRNRNIIIKVDEAVEAHEDFRWMTLGQIKELMREDNKVNMDTRTVLSGLKISDFLSPMNDTKNLSDFGKGMILSSTTNHSYCSTTEHLSWLSSLKSKYDLWVNPFPLNEMTDWQLLPDEISRKDNKYFKIIGVKVIISNREVKSWYQPLVQPMQQGICAFIIKKINGIYHFLIQAKLECGNFDVLELAPTVQCLTGNIEDPDTVRPPFLDYVLNAPQEKIIYDTLQSEEGGRFYKEQNRNLLIEADDSLPMELPPHYTWMTLKQIYKFLRFNNYLNIQSRSLIAAINYLH